MLMKSKYASKRIVSGSLIVKPDDSCIWKMIVDLSPNLDSMSYWEVDKNLNFRMWEDSWVALGVFLKDLVLPLWKPYITFFCV